MKQACFGAGCFWGVQKAFDSVKGVSNSFVGFMGGSTKYPSYEDVCSESTGHAEVCIFDYDENIVSFDELLDVFFRIHNPTQLNRQGVDVGSQYRSVIFYFDDDQKKLAIKKILDLSNANTFKSTIVTQVKPASDFWKAENYHQKYYKSHNVFCNI